jgi:hypothetical protein
MARPSLEQSLKYRTTGEVCALLNLTIDQLNYRIVRGIFPKPTFVDEHGSRFFGRYWLLQARAIINRVEIEGTAPLGDKAVP